ncbi:MAG: hypothetical protein WA825_05155 [Steroidobacteraceae bacterium]
MNVQDDRQRSRLTLPLMIAGIAVITALAAIAVALRPSPPERSVAKSSASQPMAAQSITPPAATPARGSDAQQHVSNPLLGPLRAAQQALKSENYPDALAKLEAANNTKAKSPYDQHVINELLVFAYTRTKNYQAAATVAEAESGDGFLSPAETERLTSAVATLNYQIKNYDKAIEFGDRAMRLGSTDANLPAIVAQAYYLKGDWDGAQKFVATAVSQQIAAGSIPGKALLELWKVSCSKLSDAGCEQQAMQKLRTYYPAAP